MAVPNSLAAHPCFKTVDPEACRALDRQCVWVKTQAGAWVVGQSSHDRDVYFIMTGHLRAVLNMARQDLIFTDMMAGDFFGEMSAFDGAPRAASVFAVTDSLVAKMPGPVFVELMFSHRPLGDAVVGTLIERVRDMSRRVGELGALNVRARVHAELLRLARPDREDPRRAIIVTPPNQSELAARNQHPAGDRLARAQRHGALRADRKAARRHRHHRCAQTQRRHRGGKRSVARTSTGPYSRKSSAQWPQTRSPAAPYAGIRRAPSPSSRKIQDNRSFGFVSQRFYSDRTDRTTLSEFRKPLTHSARRDRDARPRPRDARTPLRRSCWFPPNNGCVMGSQQGNFGTVVPRLLPAGRRRSRREEQTGSPPRPHQQLPRRQS